MCFVVGHYTPTSTIGEVVCPGLCFHSCLSSNGSRRIRVQPVHLGGQQAQLLLGQVAQLVEKDAAAEVLAVDEGELGLGRRRSHRGKG